MKLKDQLMLREVAGQYVIIPTGERVREVTSIVYISSSAAYLWDYMKDHEFTREDLVARVMEHYTGVTEEQAGADIDKFLKDACRQQHPRRRDHPRPHLRPAAERPVGQALAARWAAEAW